jgi:hypothetical protein
VLSRPRFAAFGLDGPPPARRGLGKRLRLGGNVTFPSTMYAAPLADGVTLGLFAAAGSAVRGHEQKTSFPTLGTKLGPGISLAPSLFFCSLKEGPFLRPGQSHAKHRAQRRSMIAQATVMRRRRRHCFREENNCKDPRWRKSTCELACDTASSIAGLGRG